MFSKLTTVFLLLAAVAAIGSATPDSYAAYRPLPGGSTVDPPGTIGTGYVISTTPTSAPTTTGPTSGATTVLSGLLTAAVAGRLLI
ncbi:unnamed protein product, partial [Mesorhabditis spiculigera]